MRLYNLSRKNLFLILAKFPGIQLQEAGQVFVTAWLTPDQVCDIEEAFPGSVWSV